MTPEGRMPNAPRTTQDEGRKEPTLAEEVRDVRLWLSGISIAHFPRPFAEGNQEMRRWAVSVLKDCEAELCRRTAPEVTR